MLENVRNRKSLENARKYFTKALTARDIDKARLYPKWKSILPIKTFQNVRNKVLQGWPVVNNNPLRGYATLIWHFLGKIYWKLRAHEKNRKYLFVDLSLILRNSTSHMVLTSTPIVTVCLQEDPFKTAKYISTLRQKANFNFILHFVIGFIPKKIKNTYLQIYPWSCDSVHQKISFGDNTDSYRIVTRRFFRYFKSMSSETIYSN